MSKRKILSAFKKKGIPVERVEYLRGCPTPSGYANGWDIDLHEDVAEQLFDAGFDDCSTTNEMDSTEQVIEWISSMPSLKAS